MNTNTIWKYPLDYANASQVLSVPGNAKFLSVIEQHSKPILYALVDPEEIMKVETEVLVRGTGDSISGEQLRTHVFLGTVKLQDGALILHIFVERTASYL